MTLTRERLARRQHSKARALGPQGIAIVELAANTLRPTPVGNAIQACDLLGDNPSIPTPEHYTVHQRQQARERVLARTVRELDPTDIRDSSNHGNLIQVRELTKPVPLQATVKLSQQEIDRRK